MVLDFAREFCNPQVGQGVMPLSGVDGKSMKNYRNSIQISPLTNRGEKKLLKFLRKACFEGQAVSFRKWFFNSIYIYRCFRGKKSRLPMSQPIARAEQRTRNWEGEIQLQKW